MISFLRKATQFNNFFIKLNSPFSIDLKLVSMHKAILANKIKNTI